MLGKTWNIHKRKPLKLTDINRGANHPVWSNE
jgi:hypothetical protein